MKKILLGAMALTMLATACKKSDNSPARAVIIDGTSYTPASGTTGIATSGSYVTTSGLNGSTLGTVVFKFPGTGLPATGDYTIVADSITTLSANQVSFIASTSANSSNLYHSTGTTAVKVSITNNNDDLTVTMPSAPAQLSGASTTINVSVNVSDN